jgi:hypothetical protein
MGAARSKARNDFARSNTGIVGSNLIRRMDICMRFFCLCYPVYIAALRRADPVQGVLPTVYKIRNSEWKKATKPKPNKSSPIYIFLLLKDLYGKPLFGLRLVDLIRFPGVRVISQEGPV